MQRTAVRFARLCSSVYVVTTAKNNTAVGVRGKTTVGQQQTTDSLRLSGISHIISDFYL